ncbi:protein Daple-like [Myotis lucifugus]|uniref:protein Daple-like n=1 Tax=Myotis lucifugus TaxID=59463 RepID=UPI000CCC39A8|nr:protein Daple-like [Myotis lucifugus]
MDGGHSLRMDVTVRELMELFLQSPLVAGVTRHQASLLDLQWLEVPDMALEEVEYLSSNMICRLRRVLIEQDHCRKLVVTMTQEWNTSICPSEDTQHLAMELADTKATLRGVRQELEEKTKQLSDTRYQLYQLVLELLEARHNNMELAATAQAARAPLPELDSLRKKVNLMERLEMEAMGLRQKEKDIDFYAACPAMLTASLCGDLGTMTQVRTGDNYSVDTKGHLQEHWIWYWIDKLFEREEDNVQLKLKLHHLQLDRDTYQKCLEKLREDNMALKTAQGQSVEESAHLRWELEQLSKGKAEAEAPGIWALTPLCSSASSCFLKLDQEKQSLQGTIQGLRDASLALQESSLQRQELEEENQQLRKQIEDLRVQMEREKQTSQDLETLCEELVEEREQLLRDNKTLKAEKAQEFKDLKKLVHSLRDSSQTSSKARMKGRKTEQKVLLQTVTDTKRKVTMMEWERRQLCRDLEQVKEHVVRAQELEQELHRLQEEIEKLAMEVSALTTAPERVHALEWESQDLLLENQRLQTSLDTLKPEGLERDKQLDTRQVENSTLSSQSASHTALTEQDTELQHQQLVAAHQALQQEHASLGALHEHPTKEHTALLDKDRRHKTLLCRTLELESKALSDRYKDQLQHKAALEQLGTLLTTEQEALQQEQRTSAMATEENQRLQGELDRANSLHQQLKREQEELQTHSKKLQTSLSDTQLQVNCWQAQCDWLRKEQEELQIYNNELQTSLNEMQLEKNRWQARYKGLKGQQEELQMHSKKLQTSLSDTQLQVNCWQAQCDWLRKEQEELQIYNNELQTSLNEMQLEKNRWQARYKGLKGQQEELQMHSKKLQTSLNDTQLDVHYWQARYEGLKQEQEEMYTLTMDMQTDAKQLKTHVKELLTHNKELQTSLKDRQLELNCWQAQCNWLREEQEELQSYNKELQTSLNEMQLEKNRWQARYKGLKGQQEELQVHSKKLQTSLNDTQLEVNCWQDQCNWLREELQSRDISLTELGNHCQLLSHLKGNLEGENRHLQSQNQSLEEQNQRLLQEDVENKDQHQEEQRQYVDKLNALQRQNETLEEKSMAQRKFHVPAPKKKKHWIGAKALVKLIKLKKGGSRERRKSTSESPPWPLGSSDQASPSTSQPLQSQLEPLEATPCCSKGSEEQDTRRGPKDKGPGDPIPKGVAPPRGSLDCTDASTDPATKPRPSELGSRACSSSAITTAPSSSTSTSRHPGRTHGIGGTKRLSNSGGEPEFGLKSGNIGGFFSREET